MKFQACLLLVTLGLPGCNKGSADAPPAACVRFARDAAIATVSSPPLAAVDRGPSDVARRVAASDPLLLLDGRSAWRYFTNENELGTGPISNPGGPSPDRLREERDEPRLYVPSGFGAAFTLDLHGDRSLLIIAEGSFGASPGLEVSAGFLSSPAPPIGDRLEPGSLRARLKRDLVGRLHSLVRQPDGGSALVYLPVPDQARSLVLIATARGGRIEHLDAVAVHTVPPLDALIHRGLVSDKLVAMVQHEGTLRPSLALPPRNSVSTRPVEVAAGSVLRFAWTVLGDPRQPDQRQQDQKEDGPGGESGLLKIVRRDAQVARELFTQVVDRPTPGWNTVDVPAGDVGPAATFEFVVEGVPGGSRNLVCVGSPRLIAPSPKDERRTNVVLVSIDTLRADRLGCMGNTRNLTPHIDALAGEGTTFESAYSHAPFTLPSHVSLFSSLLPSAHGVENLNDVIADGTPLLVERFADAGYQCGSFNAGGYLSWHFGYGRGYDVYCQVDPLGDRYFGGVMPAGRRLGSGETGSLGRARTFIQEHRDRPFFLFLHTFIAHCYLPPEDLAREFGLLGEGEPSLTPYSARRFEPERVQTDGLSKDDERRMVDAYDATVRAADGLIGDLVAALRDAGVYDDTILIVTSDHGQELLERGGSGHGITLYEEIIRVPLIVRVPGQAPGLRVTESVRHVDVFPTLLDLLDLPKLQVTQGASFAEVFDGDTIEARTVVAEVNDGARSVRSCLVRDGRKYIVASMDDQLRFKARAADELYDLAGDPAEQSNQAAPQRDLVEAMRSELERVLAVSRELGRAQRDPAQVGRPLDPTLENALDELGYLGR